LISPRLYPLLIKGRERAAWMVVQPAFIKPKIDWKLMAESMTISQKGATAFDQSAVLICWKPVCLAISSYSAKEMT